MKTLLFAALALCTTPAMLDQKDLPLTQSPIVPAEDHGLWLNQESSEREQCTAILDKRVKLAEANLRDHRDDNKYIRAELAAYLRGLSDAAFAVREGK